MYRKSFHKFALFLGLVLFSFHCFAATPPDIQRIKRRGTLVVAMTADDQPPFYLHDKSGKLVGLDAILSKDVAKKLGVKLKLDRSYPTFDSLVTALKKGKVDVVISFLSVTMDRATQIKYTTPYYSLRQSLLVNRLKLAQRQAKAKPNTPLIELLNQPDVKIGVIEGSSYVSFGKQLFPKAQIVEWPTQYDTWQAVIKGKVSAVLDDETGPKLLLLTQPETAIHLKLVLIGDVLDNIAMAVPWKSTQLLHWLNAYLQMSKIHLDLDDVLAQYKDAILKHVPQGT